MIQKEANNPADPMNWNAFDWAKMPGASHPGVFRRRTPAQIPQSDILFAVQRDLIKVIRMQKELERHLENSGSDYRYMRELKRQTENAYKLIVRYLRTYAGAENAALRMGQ